MSVTLIQPRTCSTCACKIGVGDDLYCRRFPPTQLVRIMVNPKTKQPQEVVVTSFPQVKGTMSCWEYKAVSPNAS